MIEQAILSSLIFNEEYSRKVLPYINKDYFEDVGQKILHKLIRDHYVKYNKNPTIESITIDLENSNLKESIYDRAVQELAELKPNDYDIDWLVDNTEQFCKKRAFLNAIQSSANLLQGDDTSQYTSALDLVQNALSVSFDDHVGHDYVADAAARLEKYHSKADHLPCDLELFNTATKGGFVDKSMTVFLAPTGVGKSLFLCHFASSFLTQGKNVLYITLEMAEEKIAERIDANLLDVPINDLATIDKNSFFNRMNKLQKQNIGRLIVKEYPARTVHSGHFRHLIKELAVKKGFKPDVLIVDYLGICGSATVGKGASMYDYQKSVAEEIRGLGTEFNMRVFSAAQVNREGVKSGDFSQTDVAESWGVPNTADYMYGIMSTEELEKRGQIKVKRLKDRYQDYITWMPSFVIGIDRGKMRLYDIQQVEPEKKTKNTEPGEDINDGFSHMKSKFASLINTEE